MIPRLRVSVSLQDLPLAKFDLLWSILPKINYLYIENFTRLTAAHLTALGRVDDLESISLPSNYDEQLIKVDISFFSLSLSNSLFENRRLLRFHARIVCDAWICIDLIITGNQTLLIQSKDWNIFASSVTCR